ncbi:MAG TPA: hypothetical protein V6C81_19720 [Planktothrix sp.]|jgi:hypothetical protein
MPDSDSDQPLDRSDDSGTPIPAPSDIPARPQALLKTDIGKVVGGIESLKRFQDLLAKTLRLQK